MNNKGWEVEEIAKLLLVVLVVGAGIWFLFFSDLTGKALGIIPGLGGSHDLPEGVLIVRADIAKNFDLEYNTVDGWRSLKGYPDNVKLETFSFSKKELQDNLKRYYFDTPRESQSWFALSEPYRIFHDFKLNSDGSVTARDELLPALGKSIYDIKLDGDGTLSSKSQSSYGKYVDKIISWRDEILQGGICEKLLEVNVNDVKNKYQVRRPAKTDVFLVVDLSRRVDGIKTECVKGTPEENKDFQHLPLRIDFSIADGEYSFAWDKSGDSWSWNIVPGKGADSSIVGEFQNILIANDEFNKKNFYNGLVAISDKLTQSYGGFFGINSDKSILSKIELKDRGGYIRNPEFPTLIRDNILSKDKTVFNKDTFVNYLTEFYYTYGIESFDYIKGGEDSKDRFRDFSLYRQQTSGDVTNIYYNGKYAGLFVQKQSFTTGPRYFVIFSTSDGKSQKVVGEVVAGVFARSALLADPPEAPLTEDGFAHILSLDGKKLNDIPIL